MSIDLFDEPPQSARKTIIEEALAREVPFLPPEEANAEILKLHLQVGKLEGKNGALGARNAELERVIKTMCRGCALRITGACDWLCRGRDYNDTEDLRPVDLTALQEIICGQA